MNRRNRISLESLSRLDDHVEAIFKDSPIEFKVLNVLIDNCDYNKLKYNLEILF